MPDSCHIPRTHRLPGQATEGIREECDDRKTTSDLLSRTGFEVISSETTKDFPLSSNIPVEYKGCTKLNWQKTERYFKKNQYLNQNEWLGPSSVPGAGPCSALTEKKTQTFGIAVHIPQELLLNWLFYSAFIAQHLCNWVKFPASGFRLYCFTRSGPIVVVRVTVEKFL